MIHYINIQLQCLVRIDTNRLCSNRSPAQYVCQIQKILAGVLALSGKKVYKTQKSGFTQNPICPPLPKNGDHPPHGGESPSFDWTFEENCLCQQVIYPLGSVLMRAIFDWCCPHVAVALTSLKNNKKVTMLMRINKYHPNASLTRTLICHCGSGMHIALPTPFAMVGGGVATMSCTVAATKAAAERPGRE